MIEEGTRRSTGLLPVLVATAVVLVAGFHAGKWLASTRQKSKKCQDPTAASNDDEKRPKESPTSNGASMAESSDESGNEGAVPTNEYSEDDGPLKLVLVVNQELKMGKGKMAAQCCHATLGCYKRAKRSCPSALRWWEWHGQAKIAVKCPTQAEMLAIAMDARQRGLVTYLVADAGRTQIAAGSQTVLGIGPAPVWAFEGLTSHLALL
ncbi:unnamed protein product [Phaeothamnion confervicola]